MLYLDGVYDKQGIFYPVKSPTYQDVENIAQKIAERVLDFPGFTRHLLAWKNSLLQTALEKHLQCDYVV